MKWVLRSIQKYDIELVNLPRGHLVDNQRYENKIIFGYSVKKILSILLIVIVVVGLTAAVAILWGLKSPNYERGYAAGYRTSYQTGFNGSFYDIKSGLSHNNTNEGYTNGYDEGYTHGYDEGYPDGQVDRKNGSQGGN